MFGYIDLVVFISVLGAAAMLLPTALNWNHMAFTAQVAQLEAQQLATITDAALQYEYANSATLDAPNSSHTVTVANLIAQGYLPNGTKATDTYGNPITVQFNADGSGNVTGYVVDQGQKIYSNLEAGRLMLDLGDRGGYMPTTLAGGQQPNVIYGSGGTWQLGAPAGLTPGSIEVKVEPNAAQEADDSRFLWRVPAPNASENTMSTPLIMAATEPEGAGCSYTGAIAQDGTGALVSCQGGQWTAVGGGQWKTPVSTYAALPGSGNQVGDVRLTEDTDRAFAWSGAGWNALAVDQNGDLTVPRHLSAENGGVTTSTSCSGQGVLTVGDITMTSDNGCGAGGSAVQMGNPVTGQGYAIVDSQGRSLDFWNWSAGHSVMQMQPNGEWDMNPSNADPDVVVPGQGNNSVEGNSWWGIQPRWSNGWSLVTSEHGYLNANPQAANGSVDVNDIDVRSGGPYPWYSQLSNQVYSDTQQLAQQGNAINNLSNEYAGQQGQINSINSNLNNSNVCASSPYAAFQTICSEIQNSGGSYVGAFGPATQTTTSTYSCGWRGPWWSRYWGCGWTYSSGPASASGTANGGGMTVDGQGSGPTLPYKALLISVTGLVGSQNGGGQGANWGGLSTPCGGNGVGASILAYVGPTQVADISLTKTGQPDYQTWVVTENTATFVVPAGQSFSIQANSNCAQFRGVVWAL
ncbi:MAG: hypothetical protein ACYCV6_02735 [Steroidobacteraceae bacterium]